MFDEVKKGAKTLAKNANHLTKNDLTNMYNPKTKLTISELKEATQEYTSNKYLNIFNELGFKVNYSQQKNVKINKFYNEELSFYEVNLKNNLFKNLISQIKDFVISDVKLSKKNGDGTVEKITKISDIYNNDLIIDDLILQDMIISGLLYERFYIKINLEEGQYNIEVLPDYKVFKNNQGNYYIPFFVDGETFIEFRNEKEIIIYKIDKKGGLAEKERYDNSFLSPLIFKMDVKSKIVSEGLLELLLLYSQVLTAFQKEVILSTIKVFADKGFFSWEKYTYLREHFEMVETPTSLSAETQNKPLFETIQPNLRASDYDLSRDLVKEEIATTMRLDKSILGLDSSFNTATEVKARNVNSIKTINNLKKVFEISINNFLKEFLKTEDYYVNFGFFTIENEKDIAEKVSNLKRNGLITTKSAIEELNPDLTNEEIEVEYLTLIYKNGEIMTADEEKRAKELGIMPKVEKDGRI